MVGVHRVGATGDRVARELAATAARRAGISVRVLSSTEELGELTRFLGTVWPQQGGGGPIHLDMLRALDLAGGYLGGAYDGSGTMVGGSVAFATLGEPLSLHSHATGVSEAIAGRGVGFAMKVDQRAWALERSVKRIGWTFDPLVRRNAVFNLSKLGAQRHALPPRPLRGDDGRTQRRGRE